uniref:Heat shock factor-binding protein 1 n=1 Tax=Podarcis muralis TaxID=64176 RepID=A0A670J298_PODMU
MAETDPKTVQDLTAVVQTLLQQMQDKFQTMSDQIIGRNILRVFHLLNRALCVMYRMDINPPNDLVPPKAVYLKHCRIDDLEKNIADLMTQAGVEELEGENKAPATKTSTCQ